MSAPGEGSNGNVDGGTARGGAGCTGGGVIPLGDSVSGYGGGFPWSSRAMGGTGLRDSSPDLPPPDDELPVCPPAE